MDYTIVLKFQSDDRQTASHLHNIIDEIAPYMVDNVDSFIAEKHLDVHREPDFTGFITKEVIIEPPNLDPDAYNVYKVSLDERAVFNGLSPETQQMKLREWGFDPDKEITYFFEGDTDNVVLKQLKDLHG